MKNKFLIIIIYSLLFSSLCAENLNIQSKKISIDKKNKISIFEDDVIVTTNNQSKIKSEYAKLDKNTNILILEKNVQLEDQSGNIIETDYAEYKKNSNIFESKGKTKIVTSESYIIDGSDIKYDSKNKIIRSSKETTITDLEINKIYSENFEYNLIKFFFKSVGSINIIDKLNNSYKFSQIYIDTKKKEIIGTDAKAFMNQDDFKLDSRNKPRIFSNSIKISNNDESEFNKSVFTLCDYRSEDKCPPWEIRSSKMLHDNKKKTIYYENALIKVYNIPVFYIPKISHPDPTVDRRSGFLPPSYSDTKNLGEGLKIPYFFDLGIDKNFTLTSNIYLSENPLFLGSYHQAFKNSFLMTDFGYTPGYKKTSLKKKAGAKSHFFSKYEKNFITKNSSENSLKINIQEVSNDKYLKLYKIKSNLVDNNINSIEKSLEFSSEKENSFFGFNAAVYETLKESYNDKYEYILPEITLDKNLEINNNFGYLDYQANIKAENYDTNKTTKFFTNDFNWESRDIITKFGLNNKLLGNLRNINYETKNIDLYKNDFTSEIYGSTGFFTSLDLTKNYRNTEHLFSPKFFIRYAPGSMRKEDSGSRLTPLSAFSINRLNKNENFETGLTGTIGFDYTINEENNKKFDFSIAQIINKEENKKMSSESSMDEKLSDLVGSASYTKGNMNLSYNFNLDQNYNELNYNELSTSFNFTPFSVNFDYLKEQKHLGDQEYFKTKLGIIDSEKSEISFETKRNLVTSSSEYYNLSYEYINDCLRAGLVYRREFYNDSEIEPENSLMFKITLSPFGDVFSPSFSN
mgnify:CR=1 FL=1